MGGCFLLFDLSFFNMLFFHSGDFLIWNLKVKTNAEPARITVRDALTHSRPVFNIVQVGASDGRVASFSLDRSVSLLMICDQ